MIWKTWKRSSITSPADVDEHRKAELQDAEVTEKERISFKQLCEEFTVVFSKSSEDIGRTPLVTMEIETRIVHLYVRNHTI